MNENYLPEKVYPAADIARQRDDIRGSIISVSDNISGGDIIRISADDLMNLFHFYDELFLNNYFRDVFRGKVSFSLSRRMTRNAGKIVIPKSNITMPPEMEKYEIVIGIEFFFKYNQINREKTVNGLPTRDALEALQLVFEHELCHLIEAHFFKKTSCRGKRFKNMALNFFGHTRSHHHLPTNQEIAQDRYGFGVGQRVSFVNNGMRLTGMINRINKRATIMVPCENGDYQDSKGACYRKWYVPLSVLEKE